MQDLSYIYAFLLFVVGAACAIGAYFSIIGWKHQAEYSPRLLEIGTMMQDVKCNIEGDDEERARIMKMSVEEYKTEREKGRVIIRAGQEVCGIAEGLKSPFHLWR
jgi:hypothetical protein